MGRSLTTTEPRSRLSYNRLIVIIISLAFVTLVVQNIVHIHTLVKTNDVSDATILHALEIVQNKTSLNQKYEHEIGNSYAVDRGEVASCIYFSDKIPNNQSENPRPTAILHVGPHKTGTTSIQAAFSFYADSLAKENYFYLGKVNREYEGLFHCDDVVKPYVFDCIRSDVDILSFPLNKDKCSLARKNISNQIDHHRKLGHNIIISDESFAIGPVSNDRWDELRTILDGFHVKVIVCYRHYFDWIFSYYNHIYFPAQYHRYMWEWPKNGGVIVPSFQDFALNPNLYLGNITGFNMMEWYELDTNHPTKTVVNKYSEHFPNVEIIDFHGNTSIDAVILCDVLTTPQTCAETLSEQIPIHEYRRKGSDMVHVERIAQYAHNQFPALEKYSSRSRREVVRDVGFCIKRARLCCEEVCEPLETMPLVDLNESVSSLLIEKSVMYEKELMAVTDGESFLRSSFDEAKKLFGSVDLSFIFSSEWKKRLRRITPMYSPLLLYIF